MIAIERTRALRQLLQTKYDDFWKARPTLRAVFRFLRMALIGVHIFAITAMALPSAGGALVASDRVSKSYVSTINLLGYAAILTEDIEIIPTEPTDTNMVKI